MTAIGQGRTEYEIHLASDRIDARLMAQLERLGFRRDGFAGGTKGVVREHHFSRHTDQRDDFRSTWAETVATLSRCSGDSFYGYAEAEVVAPQHVLRFDGRPFHGDIPFPCAPFLMRECPIGLYKQFDIHISVETGSLDPRLKRVLEDDIGFYYVDIAKDDGRRLRVYTVQPLDVPDVPKLFAAFADYFRNAGGLRGRLKLEATYAYARFPEACAVPPVVREVSFSAAVIPSVGVDVA